MVLLCFGLWGSIHSGFTCLCFSMLLHCNSTSPLCHSNNRQGSLQWRNNGRDIVSNHQLHHCLLNRLFKRRSKKTSKLRVTGPCAGNSPVTGEFPAQMASNAENGSIWWRHHDMGKLTDFKPQQSTTERERCAYFSGYPVDNYSAAHLQVIDTDRNLAVKLYTLLPWALD